MAVDISKMSYKELQALATQATEALEGKRSEELKVLTDAFAKKLAAAGFSIQEGIDELKNYLPKKAGSRSTKAEKVVKYKGANPGETYGGKGPKPKWLAAQLAAGKKLEDFAV